MSFGRVLGKAITFGKQLSAGADKFGSQLGSVGGMLRRNLGTAERVVGRIEKTAGDIPLVGQGIKVAKDVIGAGKNVAGLAELAPTAIRQAQRGDIAGLRSSASAAQGFGNALASAGSDAFKSGGQLAGQAAMLL